MKKQLIIGSLTIEVTQKHIKNINLRVYPPDGEVRVSAPKRISMEKIRMFVTSKLEWIKKQQQRVLTWKRDTPKDIFTQQSCFFQGRQYPLEIIEHNKPAKVVLSDSKITVFISPGTAKGKIEGYLNEWYRRQLKTVLPGIIGRYEKIMGVVVEEFRIKRMKTRWGTCNISAKRIWLNLELAKKPPRHLEYVVVHEMVHLLERYHNNRFKAFMDRFLPNWRVLKEELNRFPSLPQ